MNPAGGTQRRYLASIGFQQDMFSRSHTRATCTAAIVSPATVPVGWTVGKRDRVPATIANVLFGLVNALRVV